MELRQLRYFVAIVDHGSLSRAALILHVAQPALTQQLRQLEEELGVELFARGRNVSASVTFAHSLERPAVMSEREAPIYFRLDFFL